jgi:hypothetical protein
MELSRMARRPEHDMELSRMVWRLELVMVLSKTLRRPASSHSRKFGLQCFADLSSLVLSRSSTRPWIT